MAGAVLPGVAAIPMVGTPAESLAGVTELEDPRGDRSRRRLMAATLKV